MNSEVGIENFLRLHTLKRYQIISRQSLGRLARLRLPVRQVPPEPDRPQRFERDTISSGLHRT